MLEMLLVPFLGLTLFSVHLDDSDDEDDVTGDDSLDASGPVSEPAPLLPDPEEFELAQRVTNGSLLTGSAAGVSESGVPGLLNFDGSDGADVMEVADGETRFTVNPGGGADQVSIGLNSDVTMGAAEFGNPVTTFPSEGQGLLDRFVTSQDISDLTSDEITLTVTEEGLINVPEGGAQIDLSDPDDALVIDLPETVEGNLHLIRVEDEEITDGSTVTSYYTLAVLTDPGIASLSDDAIDALVSGEGAEDAGTVLARIDQGSQTLTPIDSLPGTESEDYARLFDLNRNPMITATRAISSETTIELQAA